MSFLSCGGHFWVSCWVLVISCCSQPGCSVILFGFGVVIGFLFGFVGWFGLLLGLLDGGEDLLVELG